MATAKQIPVKQPDNKLLVYPTLCYLLEHLDRHEHEILEDDKGEAHGL